MNSDNDKSLLARVVEEVRARRASGEMLPDEAVLDAHPDLRTHLAAELRKLDMIQRARRLAGAVPVRSTLHADAPGSTARLASDSIPGYEILREIHRGSQGVVYLAVQKSTHREVAVKVMKHGPFADDSDRMRFEREVHVLSALKHPNIVSIHDSGAAAGHSYVVMNYVEGEPLDAYVANAGLTLDALLRLFVKICDAVNAAQLCGVIHRDLKPGNIRIDRNGEPHVLDFGLAKIDPATAVRAAGQDAAAGADALACKLQGTFTQTGQFVGSLPWASPEQAEGQAEKIDIRTDVYSLGVVLYQVLTGRFPYPVSGSLRAVLENIQHAAPIRPSLIRREINDEVETIVLRCLQKERERRYESAGELSRDLQRYLKGEPLDAKRDSRLYVLRKQLQRYRLPVLAALAVFLSLIAGIIATTRSTRRALQAEADALVLAQAESQLRHKANWELYKACLAAADAALTANNTAMAKARLDAAPAALRDWEWRYLNSRLDQSLASYAIGPIATRFVLSPDRRTAFIALGDGRLLAFEPLTGKSRTRVSLPGHTVTMVAIAPDGLRIALGLANGEVRIHACEDGREVRRFLAHAAGPVSALAFSGDGKLLATGGSGAAGNVSIRIWDSGTADPRGVMGHETSWVNALAFHPDGRTLASGHTKDRAGFRIWDVETARQRAAVDYEGLDVYQLEFSPDGARLAVASQDSTIHLYDDGGRQVGALSGHSAAITHVTFSPEGTRLASASVDQTVRVWDLDSGAVAACRRGHLNTVHQVAFLAGGDRLLSMSLSEPPVKVWDTRGAEEPATFDTGKYFVIFLKFSADGRRLYTHQRCWDTATRQLLARLSPRPGWQANSWISPDESLEWLSNASPEAGIALMRRGEPLVRTSEPLLFRPIPSPDVQRVALALQRGVIQVYSAQGGSPLAEISTDPKVNGAGFSHDATSLLTWNSRGVWTIWDAGSGREKLARKHGSGEVELVNAVFSADDKLVATASYDGSARVWDALTGKELHVLRPVGAPPGDPSVVWSVAFSPDGKRLATGSKDRRIRLWDVATGQELMAFTGHAGTVMCLDWSPDGTQLASGGFDGTVCLWDSLSRAERTARTGTADALHQPFETLDPPTSSRRVE